MLNWQRKKTRRPAGKAGGGQGKAGSGWLGPSCSASTVRQQLALVRPPGKMAPASWAGTISPLALRSQTVASGTGLRISKP